jgi:hypothetical protein
MDSNHNTRLQHTINLLDYWATEFALKLKESNITVSIAILNLKSYIIWHVTDTNQKGSIIVFHRFQLFTLRNC